MSTLWRTLTRGWLAVLLCAALVLLAGSRLVVLSLQQTELHLRSAAQATAQKNAAALTGQIEQLTLAARRAPGQAAAPLLPGSTAAHGELLLGADGTVAAASGNDRVAAAAIAEAWRQADPAHATDLLGPIPVGNRWLVAARAPLQGAAEVRSPAQGGWHVAYRYLDELLLGAGVTLDPRAGYDFELTGIDTGGRRLTLASSAAVPLTDAVRRPVGWAREGDSHGWSLAVRPRGGWFPGRALAVDVSLLLLVTWLVSLAVRDAARHLLQLRSALLTARHRLHQSQRRLAEEIERRDQLQRNVEFAQFHDSFTGLPNRQFFLHRLDRAMRDLRGRPEGALLVLLIGIDRFKVVTDTLGHTAGDELMLQITRQFGRALGSREYSLARWSEEELALLLPDVPDAAAGPEVAGLLQLALQAPLELRRHRVVVATSMGASFVDSGTRRTEEIMREADIALSAARERTGQGSFAAFSASMQSDLLELVSLEADLQRALERDELRLLFQPIVDLRERRVVGLEALLRWRHPAYGLLRPDRFLALAEEGGLIVPITHWVIDRVCEVSRQWRSRLPPRCSFYVSINLSRSALLDPGLHEHVDEALEQSGVPAGIIKFEVTENSLIQDAAGAHDALERLHALGIELMLDDFGTGYSSLSHLQLFPFDYIKIDGPFESAAEGPQEQRTLVRAIAQVASTLGLKTVAELVESAQAAQSLERMGCEFAQGNAFSAPLEAEQAFQRLCAQLLEPLDEMTARVLQLQSDDSPTMILPMLDESTTS